MSVSAANGALPHCVKPASETPELPTPKLPSQPQSPTRPQAVGQSKIDQMNELAANARRERKVLDLEISNSSLLAINRTLEREMRKQNAELRRFRRLSRSGRLSVAPASCSASGKISMTSETVDDPNDDLSPLDCDENEHNAKDFFSDHSSPASSPPFSPTARASHARFQDPKRIELDLAAHRALLLDGQKLNQSIKRCLLNSESLLASGKQALEYQACAPEPESLGARVLTPEEIEGSILAQGQGLLSPSLGAGSNPWERDLGSMGSLDGGFETPDYSKWGPSTEVLTPFAEGTIELALDRPEKAVTARDSLDAQSKDSNPLLRALDGQSRRASEIASLDGVDDSLDSSTLEYESNDEEIPARPESSGVDNASPTKMMFSMSPPDLKGNVPGNRGSMQNLGHYLQAFSIFGTSQQT